MDFRGDPGGDPDFVRKRYFLTLHSVFLYLLNLSQSHCGATWQFLTAIGGPTLSCPPAPPSEARRVAPHLRAASGSYPLHATLSAARRRRWAARRCGEIGAAPEGLGCHCGSKTCRSCYLPMAGSGPIPSMGPHRLLALWARWQGTSSAQSRPAGNFGRCLLPCHRAQRGKEGRQTEGLGRARKALAILHLSGALGAH